MFTDCINDQNDLFAPSTGKYTLSSHGNTIYPLLQEAVPTTVTMPVINHSSEFCLHSPETDSLGERQGTSLGTLSVLGM